MSSHDSSSVRRRGTAEPARRRLGFDITLRRVEPVEELIHFLESCIADLEQRLPYPGRCDVVVQSASRGPDVRVYEVTLRLVSRDLYDELRHAHADLFTALRGAFERFVERVEVALGLPRPGRA